MTKSVFLGLPAHGFLMLSLLGLAGCYSTVEVGDGPTDKAIAIDWVEPACAEPGSDAGYIEGNGFGAKNVTVTVGGIEAQVLAATGHDASFVVPEGIPPGEPIEVVVMNPGGRIATIQWVTCEVECSPPDCDDGNECTTDTCDLSNGTCINDPIANGTLCGTGGVCEAGACRERSWGTPALIHSNDTVSEFHHPDLGVGANGDAFVVWDQFDGTRLNVWARRYTPNGGWGVATPIETSVLSSTERAAVAVSSDGNAIALWVQTDVTQPSVWANHYSPGAGWGTPELVETDEAGPAVAPARIAVDPDGRFMAVWSQDDGNLYNAYSNRYVPGIGWGVAELVEASDQGHAFASGVALDSYGNATAAWWEQETLPGGTIRVNAWANRYVPSAGWGIPELLETDPILAAESPIVAATPRGEVTALWRQSDGTGFSVNSLWANRYVPGTGWEGASLVRPDGVFADQWRVAVDHDGNATALWRSNLDSIWTSRYTSGGTWSSQIQLNTDPDAWYPDVATDSNGNVTAVWVLQYTTRARSARYLPVLGWTAPVDIGVVGGNHMQQTHVGVDSMGNATAVWEQRDGTGLWDIWSNRYE